MQRLIRRGTTAALAAVVVTLLVVLDRGGLFGQAARPDMEVYHQQAFPVVRVVDGDTLDVAAADRVSGRENTRIRLWGVDTPETVKPDTPVQHYGPEATAFTKDRTLGATVTLQLTSAKTRDKYGRLLAYVLLADGTNLNEQIVLTGHGYADPIGNHPHKGAFKKAQAEAMSGRRGLWAEADDEDLPWYYRGKLKLPATRPAAARSSE